MFVLIEYLVIYNNSNVKFCGLFLKIHVPKNNYQIKIIDPVSDLGLTLQMFKAANIC